MIPGPNFCCTFPVGRKYQGFDVHRTGIALYLHISNVGSAPSSIEKISIAYLWYLKPFSLLWLKNTIGWFWIKEQSVCLSDFQVTIGEHIKFYPFLNQESRFAGSTTRTFLEVGRSANGVVYFEQEDSWGGCLPAIKNELIRIKVKVLDVLSKKHQAKFSIPFVSLEHARKYNPSFGRTLAELYRTPLPFDSTVQAAPLQRDDVPSS